MERKEYLDLCRECAMTPNGSEMKRKVVSDGAIYYPYRYMLSFDRKGRAVYTAILHDLKANSLTDCLLEQVEKAKEDTL